MIYLNTTLTITPKTIHRLAFMLASAPPKGEEQIELSYRHTYKSSLAHNEESVHWYTALRVCTVIVRCTVTL